MMNSNGYNQYKQNSILTATPEELTMLLYNGLVKFLMQAQDAIVSNDIQKANNSIIRAQDIVLEFKATLDMEYDVSKGLSSLYDYMYNRLIEANLSKDQVILGEILGLSKELRDTWSEAMKIAKQQKIVL